MPGAPTDLRIVPAPRALLPEIMALARTTYDEHRERHPSVFADNTFANDHGASIEATFQDGAVELDESRDIFAVMRDDVFAGYILLSSWKSGEASEQVNVEIDDICVVPSFRRQGIGRALLDFVRHQVEQGRWHAMSAYVWSGNAASEALFGSAGFLPVATRFRFDRTVSAKASQDEETP